MRPPGRSRRASAHTAASWLSGGTALSTNTSSAKFATPACSGAASAGRGSDEKSQTKARARPLSYCADSRTSATADGAKSNMCTNSDACSSSKGKRAVGRAAARFNDDDCFIRAQRFVCSLSETGETITIGIRRPVTVFEKVGLVALIETVPVTGRFPCILRGEEWWDAFYYGLVLGCIHVGLCDIRVMVIIGGGVVLWISYVGIVIRVAPRCMRSTTVPSLLHDVVLSPSTGTTTVLSLLHDVVLSPSTGTTTGTVIRSLPSSRPSLIPVPWVLNKFSKFSLTEHCRKWNFVQLRSLVLLDLRHTEH
eukprot:IDg11656t1